MAAKKGRKGGARPGAGRPSNAEKKAAAVAAQTENGIPWGEIRDMAEAGTPEREILIVLDLEEQALKAAGVLDRFRQEVARGHVVDRATLRKQIRDKATNDKVAGGSVNALALRARNVLDWDKQRTAEELEPDLSTAKERLKEELGRLALAKSQLLGRPVTPADLLYQDAKGCWPWEPEPEATT